MIHPTPEASSSELAPDGERQNKKRRTRPTISCLNCQKRKIRCDKARPCAICVSRNEGSLCQYVDDIDGPANRAPLSQEQTVNLERRVEWLESMMTGQLSGLSALAEATTAAPAVPRIANRPMQDQASSATGVDVVTPEYNMVSTNLAILASVTRDQALGSGVQPPHLGLESSEAAVKGGKWPDIRLKSQSSTRHRRDITDIVISMPDSLACKNLIDLFFKEIQCCRYFLHEGVFRQEWAQFESLRQADSTASVDPAWLSIALAVLSRSSIFALSSTSSSLTPVRLSHDLVSGLCEALELSFTLAQWMFKPQFRILQALLIAMPFDLAGSYSGFVAGSGTDWRRCMWFDAAAGIAKGLKLHDFTELHREHPLLRDPAIPNTYNMYAQEIPRRAFASLLMLDTFSTYTTSLTERPFHPLLFPDGSYTTPCPQNFPEDSLLGEQPDLMEVSELSPFIWELHLFRMCRHMRRIGDLAGSAQSRLLETVERYDAELHLDHQDFERIKVENELSESQTVFWLLTNSSFLARKISLHRPFLTESKAQTSSSGLRTTIAAQQLLKTHRRLVASSYGRETYCRSPWLFAHHFSADAVLFIQAALSPHDRRQLIAILMSGRAVFATCSTTIQSSAILRHSIIICDIMIQTLSELDDMTCPAEQMLRKILDQAFCKWNKGRSPQSNPGDSRGASTNANGESVAGDQAQSSFDEAFFGEAVTDFLPVFNWEDLLNGF